MGHLHRGKLLAMAKARDAALAAGASSEEAKVAAAAVMVPAAEHASAPPDELAQLRARIAGLEALLGTVRAEKRTRKAPRRKK